jgi:hypothetical protein
MAWTLEKGGRTVRAAILAKLRKSENVEENFRKSEKLYEVNNFRELCQNMYIPRAVVY